MQKFHTQQANSDYNHTKGTQRGDTVKVPTYATQFHVYSMECPGELPTLCVSVPLREVLLSFECAEPTFTGCVRQEKSPKRVPT
jgi:hypothetical protein